MNHNVWIALLFTVSFYISQSISSQGVFSAYVYLLTNGSSAKVGYLTGISGLAQVLSAPVFAYLADKTRRDRLLRLAGVIGVVVAAGTAVGIYEGLYPLLCWMLIGAGIFNGAQNPAMEALFAESILPGERSKIFTLKYALVQSGPLCSLVMFHVLGNEWEIDDTRKVIYCGLAISVLPSFMCFFFDDDKAIGGRRSRANSKATSSGDLHEPLLDKHGGGINSGSSTTAAASERIVATTGTASPPLAAPAPQTKSATTAPPPSSLASEERKATTTTSSRKKRTWREAWHRLPRLCRKYYVPIIIAATDVSFGLASGMSVRFFPLFFMTDCHLSPMAVSLIYLISPLATSASSFLAQRASRKFGRIHVTIACKAIGVSLLYLLCYLSMRRQASAIALVITWILRTAAMNSTKPLTRSVIMDSAPKKYRAQWNAVESVTMATWSGSAVVGGLLVDRYGQGINNLITASMQLVSTLPLFLVVHLVPREQDQQHGAEEVVAVVGSPRGADVVIMDPAWTRCYRAAVVGEEEEGGGGKGGEEDSGDEEEEEEEDGDVNEKGELLWSDAYGGKQTKKKKQGSCRERRNHQQLQQQEEEVAYIDV